MRESDFIDQRSKLIKETFARPFSEEQSKELAEQGAYSVPDIGTYPKPKSGVKAYEKILEETGAGQLFQTNSPKVRRIYFPKAKNIVLINNQEYFLVDVDEAKEVGRGSNKSWYPGKVTVLGPIVRDNEGKINWRETTPRHKEFTYDEVGAQIQRSPLVIKKQLQEFNDEIKDYNEFIDSLQKRSDKTGTVTVLPLQIERAERKIQKRLNDIEGMQSSVSEGHAIDEFRGKSVALKLDELMEGVRTGKITDISPQDYAILLLERKFHSISTLNELKQEIVNEKMPFDEATNTIIKNFVNRIIDWQIQERQKEMSKEEKATEEREIRKEENDLPEMKDLALKKIKEITELPGKYEKAQGLSSAYSPMQQEHQIDRSLALDYSELSSVQNTLNRARQSVISLPQKTKESLLADPLALTQIKEFVNAAQMFTNRYKIEPFIEEGDELVVNQKLFGRAGTLGNSAIAAILRRIIASVNSELSRIGVTAPQVPAPSIPPTTEEKAPPAPVTPVPPVTANTKPDINKISSYLWEAFQKRMHL